jgi:hypothetical protein
MSSNTEQDPRLPWSAFLDELDQAIKVPPVIRWILREIPKPRISSAISDFKISRSRVP